MNLKKDISQEKTIWIIAGEESGDLYGGYLAREMKKIFPELTIKGMGGREMTKAGVEILVDSTELGVVGLIEVLKRYPMFRQVLSDLVGRAEKERPDKIILIDYPGFNLRFAEKLKHSDIKFIYYISPQVWAWGSRRIPKIASLMEKMLVIFPFEKDVYKHVGLPTEFVGHPLVDIMKHRIDKSICRDTNRILLLPGSRNSEVDRLFTPMFQTACRLFEKNSNLRFTVAAPRPAIAERIYSMLTKLKRSVTCEVPIEVVEGETELWMQKAIAGLAASGTVTVQSAILGLPLVVIYKVNPITYSLWKRLVDIDYITMVNLISGKEVFEEFIQSGVDPPIIAAAIERILRNGERYEFVVREMREVIAKLQDGGNTSHNAAKEILKTL